MFTLDVLENLTIDWSEDRGIIKNSTPQVQGLKLVSEMGELADNLAKGRDCRDDIGDCLVVLTNIAKMKGYTLKECWEVAYDDIKDRKGFLNEDGIFIKEGDEHPDDEQPLKDDRVVTALAWRDEPEYMRTLVRMSLSDESIIHYESELFSNDTSKLIGLVHKEYDFVDDYLQNLGFSIKE